MAATPCSPAPEPTRLPNDFTEAQAASFCCVFRINFCYVPGVPLALFYPSSNVYKAWKSITRSPNAGRGLQFKGMDNKGFPITMCFLVVI